jgi:hypothetical protein
MSGFALVCLSETLPDFRRIADELDDQLDDPRADVIVRMGTTWGVLLEGLAEGVARICEQRLRLLGVPVVVVADDDLVEPPEPTVLKSARLDSESLSFTERGVETSVPWDEFVYVDLIAVLRVQKVTYEEYSFDADSEGGGSKSRTPRRGITTTTPVQLVAVSHEPWLQLRVEVDGFRYGETGLPLRPNRTLNLLALSREIAGRSKRAHVGPLLQGPEPEMVPRPTPIPGEAVAAHRLRWRLTCLYRGLRPPVGLPDAPG